MTEAAWHSLYVSFSYKHASLICTSLSRPNAVHISGVHCIALSVFLCSIWLNPILTGNVSKVVNESVNYSSNLVNYVCHLNSCLWLYRRYSTVRHRWTEQQQKMIFKKSWEMENIIKIK